MFNRNAAERTKFLKVVPDYSEPKPKNDFTANAPITGRNVVGWFCGSVALNRKNNRRSGGPSQLAGGSLIVLLCI